MNYPATPTPTVFELSDSPSSGTCSRGSGLNILNVLSCLDKME